MKKCFLIFTFILIIILFLIIFAGCENSGKTVSECAISSDRFLLVKNYSDGGQIFVDIETHVCYYVGTTTVADRGFGYMTVLVHADGTPIIWEDDRMK